VASRHVDADSLTVSFDGVAVFREGEPTGVKPELGGSAVRIDLDLGLGGGRASYLASDLTYDYGEAQRGVHDLMRVVVKLGGRVAAASVGEVLERRAGR
jgi:hypothetical protein